MAVFVSLLAGEESQAISISTHLRAFSIHMLPFGSRARWLVLGEKATLPPDFCKEQNRKCSSRVRFSRPGVPACWGESSGCNLLRQIAGVQKPIATCKVPEVAGPDMFRNHSLRDVFVLTRTCLDSLTREGPGEKPGDRGFPFFRSGAAPPEMSKPAQMRSSFPPKQCSTKSRAGAARLKAVSNQFFTPSRMEPPALKV
jgi:hypothetical protein